MEGMSDGILSAVIGAGAALITVAITVGGAAWVAARQLKHDREERAVDRALQSKRDRLFVSMAAASDVSTSILGLARPERTIAEASSSFNDAVRTLAAGSSVASIEVVIRGRDLVGRAGPLFLTAMAKRRSLEGSGNMTDWVAFVDWAIHAQVELQNAYALLLASVRRDLGIPDSADYQVIEATRTDVKSLLHAMEEAREFLAAGTGT